MMKKLCLVFISLLVSLTLTTSVLAAGFALTEPSARANGLGGATVAQGGDASVLFSNPAAMTRLPGVQRQVGAVVLKPKMDVKTYGIAPAFLPETSTTSNKSSMENNTFVAPSAYVTSQLSDKLWAGVGAFTRFGLGAEFPLTWPGRYNGYYSKVKTFEINPNVAYKFTDKLSLSAGVSAMYMDMKLQKKIFGELVGAPPTQDVDQMFKGDSWGYGFNLGVHYQALDWMSIGLAYRSRVRQHIDGSVNYTDMIPAQTIYLPSSVNCKGTIKLPEEYFLGIAFKPIDRLTWEVGGVLYGWSSYDKLQIAFEQPINGGKMSVSPKNWKDSWRFQTGLEYKATDWMDLRLSYVYDQSPIPDTTIDFILPDSDRNVFGAGLGFHGKSWTLDASFNYLIFNNRDIVARGANFLPKSELRHGVCYLYGLSFGYKF